MNGSIPPSAEVELTENQAAWEIKKKKTEFWLSFMSWSVCLMTLLSTAVLGVWAGAALVDVLFSPNRDRQVMYDLTKEAGSRTALTLLGTIIIAVSFDCLRGTMNRVRWNARERLGDRPSENDVQADNYEMLDVDLVETEAGGFLATVNGWQFVVGHKVNQVADGAHRMDFSFTEVNNHEGLSFGSSVIMDEFHRETKHEAIKTALSKMVHVYPELETSPPEGYYK